MVKNRTSHPKLRCRKGRSYVVLRMFGGMLSVSIMFEVCVVIVLRMFGGML